jgi:glucose/arabinose dehydrogenase
VAPSGDVYLSRRQEGDVLLLRDTNRDGVADQQRVVARGIKLVHGLALHGAQLYMVSDTKLLVADVQPDGSLGTPRVLLSDLPDAGQHPNRTIAFGPDGLLYLTVGSNCNNCREPNPEAATVLVMRPDGSQRQVFAKGLRNTIGFDWHPGTGRLYGWDHGSDFRGDDRPPEELNELLRGRDYGWPWCFAVRQPDRWQANDPEGTSKAAYCAHTAAPSLLYTAHAAPIGFLFYSGRQFPADYRGDGFVALRGSWNRGQPSGYKVVRVRFDANGQPVAAEDFVTGWLLPARIVPGPVPTDGSPPATRVARFGRVAGLAVAADGALLIAEDENGVIYRVSYAGLR